MTWWAVIGVCWLLGGLISCDCLLFVLLCLLFVCLGVLCFGFTVWMGCVCRFGVYLVVSVFVC